MRFVTKAMPINNINSKCHKETVKAVELVWLVIQASFNVNAF